MAAVTSAGALSGAQWVARFPTSAELSDLSEPFRGNVRKFFAATANAGGTTILNAPSKKVDIKKVADRYRVGASYDVIKLENGQPHWSIDRH